MFNTQDIIPRNTAAMMAENFAAAMVEIQQGYALLRAAEIRLADSFGGSGCRWSVFESKSRGYASTDEKHVAHVCAALKCSAWQSIAARLNVKAVLTEKRAEELDRQLSNPEKLPDISPENIAGLFAHLMENFSVYESEMYRDAFEYLCRRSEDYKTASVYGVGEKTIISGAVSIKYGGGGYRVGYYRPQELRNLDNVFSLLDGKGPAAGTGKSYYGALYDAIEATGPDGKGQTDYFRFRCFGNGNLHLWFRRMNLVQLLNEKCGCTILPKKTPPRASEPSTTSTGSTARAPRAARVPMDRATLESKLRATWTANNVPPEKQNEMIARLNRAA